MEKNNKWSIDLSYPNFNEAVRVLKKFAGKKGMSRGSNAYVYMTLKKTGLFIMALESSAVCKATAGYALSAFRATGIDGSETVAMPLELLMATAKRIRKSSHGYVSLIFENGTATAKLEDNIFLDDSYESAPMGDVSKLFPTLTADESVLDFAGYDPVGEGSAGSFSHALETALLGAETDKNKIAKHNYDRKVIISLENDRLTAIGTNGEKMAVSEIPADKGGYRLTGKPLEVAIEGELAKVLADAIKAGSQGVFSLTARDNLLGIIIKTSPLIEGYAFLVTGNDKEGIPNWRKVIPADLTNGRIRIKADAASLLVGIDGIRDVVMTSKTKACYITLKDKKITLSASVNGQQAIAQAVPAEGIGSSTNLRLGMNIKYLQDSILGLIDTQGMISISLKSPVDAVVFFNSTDRFLVMPVDITTMDKSAHPADISIKRVTVK